ncbi:DUF5518 domain-containing protein [Methanobacterium sp.]|uniref:DUF5518 domain-containing protein n=1 Tax=Methanobacterium sp. TaxID=2164 RepID=UPI003C7117F1
MDLKIIGLGALINIILTNLLTFIFFPLFFLGPLIGGFLSSYLTEGFENYDTMDEKDGAVVGAISGLIGGIIIALLYIIGLGAVNIVLGSISTKFGIIAGSIIAAIVIINISTTISLVLGLIGGVIGVVIKK